ncbi:hypothetical protein PMAYCL1PPCAC_08330, partial [Pristionchus mayeri]
LSSPISAVVAGSYGRAPLTTANLSLAEQILRHSTIDQLCLDVQNLDDVTAPLILSIASRAEQLGFSTRAHDFHDDPVAIIINFICKLDSFPISRIAIC